MQQKLKQLADQWAIKADWNRPAMPEVLNYNKQYRKENPDKYGYNADIKEYILTKETIPNELHRQLETEVYLSQKDLQKEAKEKTKNEMLASGFIPLTETLCQQAIDENKKLHIIATTQNDWATVNIDKKYTPKKWGDKYALIPPKCRTRGHNLHQFGDNAYAKLTN